MLLAAPASRLPLWVPGKPVHLPVPGPDPVASAGSDWRRPRWDLPGARGVSVTALRAGASGLSPRRRKAEARRPPLPGCSAPWTRSPGGRTPSRWRCSPRGPVCRPAEVGPCQQEALPRPEQRGRSSEPDPYEAQDEPPALSPSRDRGPISRSLAWDSHPNILLDTWPLWSPKPLLPPSWSPGATPRSPAATRRAWAARSTEPRTDPRVSTPPAPFSGHVKEDKPKFWRGKGGAGV